MTIKTGVVWKKNSKKGTLSFVNDTRDLTDWKVKEWSNDRFDVKKKHSGNHFFTMEIKKIRDEAARVRQTEEIDITITNDDSNAEEEVKKIFAAEDTSREKTAAFKSTIVLNSAIGQGPPVWSFVKLEIDEDATGFRFATPVARNTIEFANSSHSWMCQPINRGSTSTRLFVRVRCTGHAKTRPDDTEEIDVTVTNEETAEDETAPMEVDYVEEVVASEE